MTDIMYFEIIKYKQRLYHETASATKKCHTMAV